MAIKATKEGPRKILIVAARASQINIRDAVSGLLLRIIEVPEKITVYSLMIDRGILHCGTNQNELISFDFTVIFRSIKAKTKNLIIFLQFPGWSRDWTETRRNWCYLFETTRKFIVQWLL